MKRLALIPLLVALILSSCTQEMPQAAKAVKQEVIFTSGLDGGFKSDPYNCDNEEPDYAEIIIQAGTDNAPIGDAFTRTTPVFFVDGIMFTQAIKLDPGTFTVRSFQLFAEATEEGEDDELVNAVPEHDSEFGALVANPLPQTFMVSAFAKAEVPLGVLCFVPTDYLQFGFAWFRIDETVGRQKWFFGDFCTKFYKDYAGSKYAPPGTDPKVDMPAIFKIGLYLDDNKSGTFEDDELVQYFGNEADYMATGAPMAVNYLDAITDGDLYEMKVQILVKTGDSDTGEKQFEYKYFGSWYFEDDSFDLFTNPELTEGHFDAGHDGVYDFVLGNCTADAADYAFAPYMNLPETVTMIVGNQIAPGPEGGAYLDIKLKNFNSGFDIEADFWYGSYCFDQEIGIASGVEYEISVFSSLNVQLLPSSIRDKRWDEVNWLANHLEDFPGYAWGDLQQAIWELENDAYQYAPNNGSNVPASESMVNQMVAAALQNGPGYIPMPGGWAAVPFVKTQDIINEVAEPSIQTVFIIVDP